jgi:hypothetical protein
MPESSLLYVLETERFIVTKDNSHGILASVPDQKSLLAGRVQLDFPWDSSAPFRSPLYE